MKDSHAAVALASLLFIFALVLSALVPPPSVEQSSGAECSDPRPEICTFEYNPVCGWFGEDIQCIRYPCAADFGNPCQSCADEMVAKWTAGSCPTG